MPLDFNVRDFCYPVSLLKLRRFFEASQWFSREALVRYQEESLRAVVWQAYHQVPYYRDVFDKLRLRPADIKVISDLEKLPLLSKQILRSEFGRLQSNDRQRYRARVAQTSGTSGEPIQFLLDKRANVLEFAYYWRHWSWAGYRLGARFAELSSSFFLRRPEHLQEQVIFQPGLGRLLLNSLALSPSTIRTHVQAIRRYHPRFLKGTPSALYYLALFLEQQGITDLCFRGIFATGEILLPWQRSRIEKVLHAKVFDSYGHMERTVAASECPSGRLHTVPEYGIFELLKQRTLGEHSAKVIGTSLHNMSMPLLRYETGDVAELTADEPCPCGRAAPCIERINGRQNDVVITPTGQVITTLFILFDEVPGLMIGQFVQNAVDRLTVRLVIGAEYTNQSEVGLVDEIRRCVGPDMYIDMEYLPLEEVRGDFAGKFRTVISRLDASTLAAHGLV